ncbi:MAG: NAD-binding protein [Gammaproteobacteria bacterium]|nr:NAD-binding protein [Gammaproteobacteria bacterium]
MSPNYSRGPLASIRVDRAALVVITVNRSDMALRALSYLRRTSPKVPVIARAHDLEASALLLDAGAVHAYPETIESSLYLGATALQMLQVPTKDIDQVLQEGEPGATNRFCNSTRVTGCAMATGQAHG